MSDGPANTLQKPFDRDRDGGVVGEGAGMLVLEDRDRAIERGATIHGEISGYAAGSGVGTEDAERHAEAYARVIRRALQNAGCEPQQIDLVHLQGEGSLSSDRIEAIAVHNVLGARSERVPVTTIKSATGMLGNASGPVELLMTLEMLRRGEVLPITNLQNPDPELPLNYVREPLADKSLKTALVLQRSWPNHLTALIVTPGTN